MKRIILTIILLSLIVMAGCNKKEKPEESTIPNNDNNQQQEMINNDLNKSFEDRIQEVKNYLEDFKNSYGEIHYINGERYISNATLTKNEDYYTMRFSFVTPRLYDKETLDNAINKDYPFEGFTFYKDFDSFLDKFESDGYKEIINEFASTETDSIFVTSEDNLACIFKPTPNDKTKYILVSVGLPTGFVEFIDDDTKIDITLYADDQIIIDNQDYYTNYSGEDFPKEYKFTIEEYYNKAMNGETMRIGSFAIGDEYYYKFDNSNIGSTDGYAGTQNAIEFENNCIIVKLPVQGGI